MQHSMEKSMRELSTGGVLGGWPETKDWRTKNSMTSGLAMNTAGVVGRETVSWRATKGDRADKYRRESRERITPAPALGDVCAIVS